MNEVIKVGFCVAYDWKLLECALPLIYNAADEIYLSIDIEKKTWANSSFEWDQEGFRALINSIDLKNKVHIYEDNFHPPERTAMENEVRQRNMMATKMGPGGWHIQLDCDEYFIAFDEFVRFLKNIGQKNYKFNVSCSLVTLFKQVEAGFLYVVPDAVEKIEFIQIATRTPHYEFGRRNGDFNIYANFQIIHQSWARSGAEIYQKIANWGHNNDFDKNLFLKSWDNLSLTNYTDLTNFHPIKPDLWPSLAFDSAKSVNEFISAFDSKKFPAYRAFDRAIRNSRFLSRLAYLFRKITRHK